MSAVGVIPARYGSSRLPGKPLALIAGRPMIQHVWERAEHAPSLRSVFVATDDERIATVCRGFGAPVRMTRSDHASGTDRIGEVARELRDEIIVNIQGDEPLIDPHAIDRVVRVLDDNPEAELATLAHALEPGAADDPNRVKVQLAANGCALAFSRTALPNCVQHAGIYAYRREFLLRFVALPPTPSERAHGLEQLRALEHGHEIHVAVLDDWQSQPVDVPEDLARIERCLARDEHKRTTTGV